MTHADLAASLARMNITVDAAEAHGRLAGSICARGSCRAADWLGDLAGGAVSGADPGLRRLPAWTFEILSADTFEFAPLVPGDEAPLRERVAALASWCDGFLYGVGAGCPDPEAARGGDVGEFLGDLAAIARAELEPGRQPEAGEGDYAELFEFVRAGVQLTFDEFTRSRARAKG